MGPKTVTLPMTAVTQNKPVLLIIWLFLYICCSDEKLTYITKYSESIYVAVLLSRHLRKLLNLWAPYWCFQNKSLRIKMPCFLPLACFSKFFFSSVVSPCIVPHLSLMGDTLPPVAFVGRLLTVSWSMSPFFFFLFPVSLEVSKAQFWCPYYWSIPTPT